jgi:transcriptional regulator with AAA-type ATPase domain
MAPSLKRNDTLRVWASRYARLILERCQGNKREACRVLNISYHTLQAYLRVPVDELNAASNSNEGRLVPQPSDPCVEGA